MLHINSRSIRQIARAGMKGRKMYIFDYIKYKHKRI